MNLTQDIPEVPEVSLDSLLHSVFCDIPTHKLNQVYDKLIKDGCIKNPESKNAKWRCMPHTFKKSEPLAFWFLEKIVKDIIDHSWMSDSNVSLEVVGEITPLAGRNNNSRPDGFFHMETTKPGPVEWTDILMPIEFKRPHNDQNQTDIFAKMLWSMHHIMGNDPRRRYVHGITCDNTKARLWFHDRCDIVASEGLDINKDWKDLVRVILSVFSATPVELGYDPTIKAVMSEDGKTSYDIKIHNVDKGTDEVYRTIRLISDTGTNRMVGPGTRIWEVQKLVDGFPLGRSYAMKDAWICDGQGVEHEILEKIRKEQPAYTQYFLTPLDYGFVPLAFDETLTPDNSDKTLGRCGNLNPTKVSLSTLTGLPRSKDTDKSPWEKSRKYGRLSVYSRQHYRVLFKEIGTPVHDLCNFTDVFTAIQGGWAGLHAMHLSGYVHRDVSSGNILLVEGTEGRRGVIIDLEYAKKIDNTSTPRNEYKVNT